MSNTATKRICIGKIAGAHGIKGLVKIQPFCDNVALLKGSLFTQETGDDTLTITLKNHMGKYILAEIKEIKTREDAEKLKCSLYVSRETFPDLEDDNEFYIDDLIGITAFENKEEIGQIIAVQNFGAGDLLEILPTSGGETYYIPFDDKYIETIDIEEKTIYLQDIEPFKP